MSRNQDKSLFDRIFPFVIGVFFTVVILGFAVIIPEPTPFQYVVFRIVLSIAVAGVSATIPGFLEVTIPDLVKAGGAMAVFVIVFFFDPASLVFNEQTSNPWVQDIASLRSELNTLESIWERVDQDEAPCQRVLNQASTLGDEFHKIPDQKLSTHIGDLIAKYHFSQYAYLMASDVECDQEDAKLFAEKSIDDGHKALQLASEVEMLPGAYAQHLRRWLRDAHILDRIHFHTAIGHVLLYRYGAIDALQARNLMEQALDEIKSAYYSEEGISTEQNRFLKSMLDSSNGNLDTRELQHPCSSTCNIG